MASSRAFHNNFIFLALLTADGRELTRIKHLCIIVYYRLFAVFSRTNRSHVITLSILLTIMENLKYRGGIYPRLKNLIIQ